ncbi:MAG: pilin major subunit VirB2 [Rhodopila sp.]|jgi:type IV secretory pathway VirB2 component (pilin)
MKNRIAVAAERLMTEAYGRGQSVLDRHNSAQIATALALCAVAAFPALANAQTVTGGASPATMINNICTFILGPFGQSLAVLGIIAIGLSWMFGRVSLGLIAGVIGGIVIMFGASYLGSTLTGGAAG